MNAQETAEWAHYELAKQKAAENHTKIETYVNRISVLPLSTEEKLKLAITYGMKLAIAEVPA